MRGRCAALKTSKDYEGINWEKQMGNRISLIRCKVEHAFLIVKRGFGYRNATYRGAAKNMNLFHVLLGCANLLMCIRTGRTANNSGINKLRLSRDNYTHLIVILFNGNKKRLRRCLVAVFRFLTMFFLILYSFFIHVKGSGDFCTNCLSVSRKLPRYQRKGKSLR